CARGAFAYW
nr:immunoglobulin heavy chain junction region [Mus musculus]